ncbi:ABC transporter ATP-binding protein [Curtobacterium sp. MCLR17_007]|uniref:ABC transporter ATP-binding protein n=1 Tax=Curtobacterium sp. MCLR17_007 TaxID=2175648 RepID=UPI000DA6FC76|nr:ABC transporter ATP-binding protein [Curtobacterium sp. MCLR17_007]WIB61365.1 ABC transporter ATP-binding protein [Curtobacterium sp. MCLR17_007]
MSLVSVRGLRKSVVLPDGSTLEILRGIDLAVDADSRTAIVGRSGSGKSTLLNILGLLDAPTDGDHRFDGVDVGRAGSVRRDRIRGADVGFVFQQFNLLQGRTAVENVEVPLLYASGRDFWRRRRLATEMLDRVGLADRADTQPHRLSGGEQQRVAIARALVRSPRLILADEPTGALDVDTGRSVMALLETVAAETGAALVTITHDPAVAARAEVVHRIDHGLVVDASAEALA